MLFIHGLGHFHPENVIDNAFLETLDIGTTKEWILERTGIESRNTVLPLDYIAKTRNSDPRAADEASLYSNGETGYRAAKMALEKAGLAIGDIGAVVAGGSAPRVGSPAEACVIAEHLGITAPAWDINSACSTFAVQMRLLSLLDRDSSPEFILVINPENLTRTVNYNDRSVAVLMGDCTTAAVVSLKVRGAVAVTGSMHESDPLGWRKVVIPSAGHLTQDGAAVQNFAIRRTVQVIEQLRPSSTGEPYFIGHQANLQMLKSACSRARISPQRHLYNVDRHGNCGAAGAPSVLSEYWNCFGQGDSLVMAVVGAGLTWAGLSIRFEGTRTGNWTDGDENLGRADYDDHK